MNNQQGKQDFFHRMAEAVRRRYELNAGKSLRDVYRLDSDFLDTRSDTCFAFQNRERMLAVLADPDKFAGLVDLFVRQSIEFTYASNQFVQIDRQEESRLQGLYTGYLHEIEAVLAQNDSESGIEAGLRRLVTRHFQDLRANISRFFDPESGPESGESAQTNVILQKVVCAEYSPEMQLEILGVQPEALAAPVLDLGCGKSGRLVRYLRGFGVPAVGVDRVVERSADLMQADWLEYVILPGEWGTVISHMAFTNHFLFHHLYRHGSIEPYARQYLAILNGLKPGGSFHYAPGLPFIETHLPLRNYQVIRKRIVDEVYACQVTNRAC